MEGSFEKGTKLSNDIGNAAIDARTGYTWEQNRR
jgi:hypothetical protein